MATIKQHLNEFEKLIEKQNKSKKELYNECVRELNNFKEFRKYTKNSKTDKEITLEKAKKILEEELAKEQDKEELARIKYEKTIDRNIKEELKNLLFSNLNEYFIKFRNCKKQVKETLLEQDTIEHEISRVCEGYEEYTDYLYMVYIQVLNKVLGLYKYEIDEIEKQEKEESRLRKQYIKDKNKRNYTQAIAIFGLSRMIKKVCNNKARR